MRRVTRASRQGRPRDPATDCPLSLRRVIRAAQRECPAGHGETLREMIDMALRLMPARGIFDPAAAGEHEVYAAIEHIAKAHLGLSRSRTRWNKALDAARLELAVRDNIDEARVCLQDKSDSAYYYAGLAFGLVFATRTA